MEDIEIFDMTLSDFEQIEDILVLDFDDFWSPNLLKSELACGQNKRYFVAKKEKEIVGFAGIMLNFPDMDIMNVVTKKNQRRKGIGKLLLDKIIEIAKNNNFENIFLEVNENNYSARELYKKSGFVEVGVRKNYYNGTENGIIMSKK